MINVNWQPGMTLESIEKEAILQAFRYYRGNKTATSQALGIAIRTLDNKLESYKVQGEEKEKADAERKQREQDYLRRARGDVAKINHAASGLNAQGIDSPAPAGASESAGDAKPSATSGSDGDGSETGVRVEPVAGLTAQHALPMSVGKKVQGVPSQQIANGHPKGNRR